MLRKLSLVAVAAASLGAAALAPTSASAWGRHGWHGGWHGGGWGWGWGWGCGAVPASLSVARRMVMVTAAAMCGDWSRRRGAPAGGW
jgi:hypothetical protein